MTFESCFPKSNHEFVQETTHGFLYKILNSEFFPRTYLKNIQQSLLKTLPRSSSSDSFRNFPINLSRDSFKTFSIRFFQNCGSKITPGLKINPGLVQKYCQGFLTTFLQNSDELPQEWIQKFLR